jgi:hypothetical protein
MAFTFDGVYLCLLFTFVGCWNVTRVIHWTVDFGKVRGDCSCYVIVILMDRDDWTDRSKRSFDQSLQSFVH